MRAASAGVALLLVSLVGLRVRLCGAYYSEVPPRPTTEDLCTCDDPTGRGSTCYEPVCPPGYFKCCVTCKEAPCFGSTKLAISWRGIPECIECYPGDFCPGCDTFIRCPNNTRPGREGPRVSAAGASRVQDCDTCSVGTEASFDGGYCMEKYSDDCSKEFVQRCINFCESTNPLMGKQLTPCEELKCMMYCSKSWSDACAARVGLYCRKKTANQTFMAGEGLEDAFIRYPDCDVDCNSAPPRSVLAAIVAAIALLHVFLHSAVIENKICHLQ